MNKKAIIVIVLFFFIGNAIAVRHVGYGAEVCGINIMPSDEDDYQKEIIAKFGDLYFDSSENPEETTSGMAMWCTQQEKRYKNNVAVYSAKLSSLPLLPTLKDCLSRRLIAGTSCRLRLISLMPCISDCIIILVVRWGLSVKLMHQ